MSSYILMPGDYAMAEQHGQISTLLGSCVALVFWHPQQQFGAMCHYVLPGRGRHAGQTEALNGRYADEFMLLLMSELNKRQLAPAQFQVSAYGAANMFQQLNITCADQGAGSETLCIGCLNVACRNRQAARRETLRHGFVLGDTDLGGTGHRHLSFDIATGQVVLKKMQQPLRRKRGSA